MIAQALLYELLHYCTVTRIVETEALMTVQRLLPSAEAYDLMQLTRDIADRELRPRADQAERTAEFPREMYRMLGRAGLLGLPYPEEYGG
ncbi:MAG: acyl-CoA dehydrogenase family protein, partial [Herbiconiux sp.]|nr:acyl-CoA dehydrogenase family protein [Herbiconiux sp.]